MNKYEEAKSNVVNTLIRIIGYRYYKNQFSHDLDVLGELVEKATPKKPSNIDYDYRNFRCPSCKEFIYGENSLIEHHYCLSCGQAIDWSEEE